MTRNNNCINQSINHSIRSSPMQEVARICINRKVYYSFTYGNSIRVIGNGFSAH